MNGTESTAIIAVIDATSSSSSIVSALVAIIMAIIALITIVGNLVVLLSYYLDKNIRQPHNYFIFSLAVSDLIIGVEGIPVYTYFLLRDRWDLGWFLCDLWLSIDYAVCLASIYTVLSITIDRYCSVKYPAAYRNWRTHGKCLLIISATWLVPSFLFTLSIFGYGTFSGTGRILAEHECYVQFMTNAYLNMGMYISYYWSTLFVMLYLYYGIYRAASDLAAKADQKNKRLALLAEMRKPTAKADAQSAYTSDVQRRSSSAMDSPPNSTGSTQSSSMRPPPPPAATVSLKCPWCPSLMLFRQLNLVRSATSMYSYNSVQVDGGQVNNNNLANGPKEQPRQHFVKKRTDLSRSTTDLISVSGSAPVLAQIHHCPVQQRIVHHRQKPPSRPKRREEISSIIERESTAPCVSPESSGTGSSSGDTQPSIAFQPREEQLLPFIDADSLSSMAGDLIKFEQLQALCLPISVSLNEILGDGNLIAFENCCAVSVHGQGALNEAVLEMEDEPVEEERKPLMMESSSRETLNTGAGSLEESRIPLLTVSRSSFNVSSEVAASSVVVVRANGSTKRTHREDKESHREQHRNVGPVDRLLNVIRHSHRRSRRRGGGKGNRRRTPTAKPRLGATLANPNPGADAYKSRSENRARKALRTITFILGTFTVFWTPFYILATIYGFCDQCKSSSTFQLFYSISYYLCYMNSPLNPFCYAMANQQFKKTMTRILKGDFRRS